MGLTMWRSILNFSFYSYNYNLKVRYFIDGKFNVTKQNHSLKAVKPNQIFTKTMYLYLKVKKKNDNALGTVASWTVIIIICDTSNTIHIC